MKEMQVKDTKWLEKVFLKSDSVVRWVRQKDCDWEGLSREEKSKSTVFPA